MKFEPFRCEDCVLGEYIYQDNCWDCSYGVADEKECEEKYEDDERM